MNAKTAIVIAVIIILAALVFYYKGLFVAATVNGSPVGRWSIIHELEKSSGKQVLDSAITRKLLDQEARKKGVIVTQSDVDTEIAKMEDQIKAQGATLDQALASQGMSRADLEEQVMLQKELEQLLSEQILITDEEVMNLLSQSGANIPSGEEEKYKAQAREQLRVQKLNTLAGSFLQDLRSKATIKYFVNY